MMTALFAAARKELLVLLRDRGGLAFLFILPAGFLFVMTMALQGVFSHDSQERIPLLWADDDGGPFAAGIAKGLSSLEWVELVPLPAEGDLRQKVHRAVAEGRCAVAVYVPPGASTRIEAPGDEAVRVELICDPALSPQLAWAVSGTVQRFAQKALWEVSGPAMARSFLAGAPPAVVESMTARLKERMGSSEKALRVERVAPQGLAVKKLPNSAQQNVPAYTVMGIFFIAIVVAGNLVRERESGAWRRILVSPASGNAILLGKIVPYFFVNILQVVFMFAVGLLLVPAAGGPTFSLGGSPGGLFLVTASASLAALGLGVFVATLGLSHDSTILFTAIGLVLLAALAGIMVPSFVMPKAMAAVGRITPQSWALEAYLDLLVRGRGAGDVLFNCVGLIAFASVTFGLGVLGFRRRR